MKKKELSPTAICRMHRRAILYRRLWRKCEPLIRRARRLVLKTYPLIRRVTHLAKKLSARAKQILCLPKALMRRLRRIPHLMKTLAGRIPRLLSRLVPRIKRLAGMLWKLLVFLQIPCRLLILILEPLVQRVKRTDWMPCEAS